MARLKHHVRGCVHMQGASVCRVDAKDLVGEFGRITKVAGGLLVGGVGVGEYIPAVRVTTVVESELGEKDAGLILWWSNADKNGFVERRPEEGSR